MMWLRVIDKKSALLLVGLLSLAGCSSMTPKSTVQPQSASPTPIQSDCAETPTGTLSNANVSRIDVRSGSASVSGMASVGQLVGYRFQGEKNQKFSHTPQDNDLCIWVYTPDNQILKTLELPTTGPYVVQISTKQREKAFNMQLYVSEFSIADFPKSICGDPSPTDPSKYPVSFYPVIVSYTEENLNEAKAKFCADAFQKTSKDTGEKIIQISSFLDSKRAEAFANFIKPDMNGVTVGSATVVTAAQNN
jgi:hypothetical protein